MNIHLNDKQKQAVEHKKGALLIIAGAGLVKQQLLPKEYLTLSIAVGQNQMRYWP